MTIRFAAARNRRDTVLGRTLAVRRQALAAANDDERFTGTDEMLREALRHFARHGIGAASDAHRRATAAFFAGDRDGYDWWLGICRALDRRLAFRAERSLGQA